MRHGGTKLLETERLILRPFRAEDGEAMFRNWAHDPEVTKYLTWQPHENAGASHAIAALWERESGKPDFYQWAIVPRGQEEPIGSLSVVRLREDIDEAEIGYCMSKAYWGRGIMPEALKAVMDYLFDTAGMNRVSACHDANNPKSGRVMEKAGMKREGTLRASQRSNRGIVDMTVYSVLAEEWMRGEQEKRMQNA